MISLTGVAAERGGRRVLSDLDLTLTERRIAIVGANGSGKSTFARLLNGLVVPSEGSVTVDGLDTRSSGKEVRRLVGFVFQNPDNQIVYPTIAEDIAFGLKGRGLDKPAVAARVAATLDRFGLTGMDDRLAHELSGGERQMLALAGVMAMAPRWLVMDEPTTLLDLRNTRRVMDAVAALEQHVVFVTHDLDLIAGFDRVLVFEAGRLVADAAPAEAVAAYRAIAG